MLLYTAAAFSEKQICLQTQQRQFQFEPGFIPSLFCAREDVCWDKGRAVCHSLPSTESQPVSASKDQQGCVKSWK